MKKLNKLSINPEKVMKNDELVSLRGGYGGASKEIHCIDGANPPYANPQPCAYYPDSQSLVDQVIKVCRNGNATTPDC